ncbi:hypothetical protein A3D80_02925 [Candidatus Roizmanbacteria bacterium RIFCSPHIGHO2_02_FULL_40_13b]|uniref:Protease PrsW n=1 Tax=Candidatus Roizmanbacteria bacterium RIFCSPHIGHO2_01_FULL_39_24 TaxID=1802032 RepID=A0A1F7GIV1_9BACT|nr:MAG: hypothetical protein A2799_02115 [Candidatus Roizmanbacteria bacterium RIFCSPHIGHO2_01_FULL_39_24]OGK27145.1 MAG: hypothetical protein A3D80_02925 [Candidatus Roizmanbacteria bacterium RIFCSPHIGHO2_02_FULL_40_13b]OGK49433.1 MAG: hypothetical protein A3A56_00060 [Candidatus Roizmanbacteria bacterium RIFCSPLOWO2_01_FULL_40_32]OGK57060.1 MAG: hypothetical protein A3H83_03685 [Candidatus Roizmanbacteria bacterium RIFCSPLOWO2_02_FULL_39_8]
MFIVTPLIAAILPFILWPLEQILPYPAVVEEFAKAVTIFFSKKNEVSYNPFITGLCIGILFSISESILYLFNIVRVGNTASFILRLFLTIPLHVTSSLIIAYSFRKGRKGVILGVTASILLHHGYNLAIPQFVLLFT